MRFLPNDPLLIFQNGNQISARFISEDKLMTIVNMDIGTVAFENKTCRIELDYRKKIINYLEKSKNCNDYFEELYFNIVPVDFTG